MNEKQFVKNHIITFALIVLGSFWVGNSVVAEDVWWNDDWNYRHKITIDHEKIDAGLVNFPVLVRLDSSDVEFSNIQTSGEDIRFVGVDATAEYDYEIELWDGSLEEAYVWVKIPSIAAGTDSEFYIYYDNDAATDNQDAVSVWDENFEMVQHMSSASSADDSLGNHDGVPTLPADLSSINANIGNGIDFNGGYFDFGDVTEFDLGVGDDLSASVWLKPDDCATFLGTILGKTSYIGINQWSILTYTSQITFNVAGSDRDYRPMIGRDCTVGEWVYIVSVMDGQESGYGEASLYVDGELALPGGELYEQSVSNAKKFRIGAADSSSSHTNYAYDGIIDEIRISKHVVSPAWIKASYYSESNDILSIGSYETLAPPDDTNPEIDLISVNIPMINESHEGSSFEITIDFNEAMDSSVSPTIAFGPTVGTVLTFSSGVWSGTTRYVATYDIADDDTETFGIDLTITNARDLTGNVMEEHLEEDEFSIDMVAPEVRDVELEPAGDYDFRDWVEITWDATLEDEDSFAIYLCDSTSTCDLIEGELDSSVRAYNWFVLSGAGTGFTIKVTATDNSGNMREAESSPSFSITEVGSCRDHNVYGWGWNPYVGWISLNCDQYYDIGSGVDYGIDVDGSDTVSGYAWSGWGDTGYWVCFGSSCGGDYIDFPGIPDPSSIYDGALSGNIDGWAKFIGWGDDGWVKLSSESTDSIPYNMNIERWSASPGGFYYMIRAFLTASGSSSPLDSEEGGYSWNNKIGWIRWYSVCADDDGDTYGAPLDGWGLYDYLDHDDRKKCGGDCIDTEQDCDDWAADLDDSINFGYDGDRYTSGSGTFKEAVAEYCETIRDDISPSGIESGNCNDWLDNDCDGYVDCEDVDDCAWTPSGPSGLVGDDDSCGKIVLEWLPGAGTADSYCASSGTETGNEFIIYRSLEATGCDADYLAPECLEVSSILSSGTTDSDECSGAEDCYIYEDYGVIPRVEYYYWIIRVIEIQVDDDGNPSTPVEDDDSYPDIADTPERTASVAVKNGPYETTCYPGSEWGEE